MAKWFIEVPGDNVADVGCGVGNLIIAYLKEIGKEKARALIRSGKLFLFDYDETALNICRHSIALLFGADLLEKINCVHADFLRKDVLLPDNCKVISNPPYAKYSVVLPEWDATETQKSSKDYYSAFLEKIALGSCGAVVITPYSFCGSKKFLPLREVLNNRSGFIVSFDNVPANIFCGRKHGIFNSNHANSVRASITVIDGNSEVGFRLSPLIRFNASEREKLLNNDVLETFLGNNKQVVSVENTRYRKCFKSVEEIVDIWQKKSTEKLSDLLQDTPNEYRLDIPNTCRYFCVASRKELKRTGKHVVYARDRRSFDYLYAFINSSFLYQEWRMYDGGITLTRDLLDSTPTFLRRFDAEKTKRLRKLVERVSETENNYLVYKKNANELQENIKFPSSVRDEFNGILFDSLGVDEPARIFDIVHSNRAFGGDCDE